MCYRFSVAIATAVGTDGGLAHHSSDACRLSGVKTKANNIVNTEIAQDDKDGKASTSWGSAEYG